MPVSKIFGGLLLLFGLLITSFTYEYAMSRWMGSASDRLKSHWQADLELLAQHKKLPPSWLEIKNVEITPMSERSQDWVKKSVPKIPANESGRYRLQILVDEVSGQGEVGAFIQYNIVDLQTGDMIWELARTIPLGTVTKHSRY